MADLMDEGDVYTDGKLLCIIKPLLGGIMPKFIDQTGKRFGRLVVLKEVGRSPSKKVLWKCLCDCGGETVTTTGNLMIGDTTSCGCYLKERITKHGGWKKSSYNSWRAMMRRCYNPKDKDYVRYGAVGITVCSKWHDYLTFEADMGEPQGKETLDRIDSYGNYEPNNCRWASPTVQARNIKTPKISKTGHIGVIFHNKKYYSCITVKSRKFYSKVFNNIEDAILARKELELKHWNYV